MPHSATEANCFPVGILVAVREQCSGNGREKKERVCVRGAEREGESKRVKASTFCAAVGIQGFDHKEEFRADSNSTAERRPSLPQQEAAAAAQPGRQRVEQFQQV